jgi:putative PIN family toxin of toxin-antitoxin system
MIVTNVLISGIIFPRFAFEILNLAFKQEIRLFLPETVLEEAKVKVRDKFPDLSPELEKLLSNCPFELIPDPEEGEVIKNKGLVRDESDIPIILSAIQAKVDFFITGDKDIIGDNEAVKKIEKYFLPLSCTTFLREIMCWSDEDLEKIRLRKW